MKKLFNVIITLVSSVCVVSLASCSSESYEGFDFDEYNAALTYTVSSSGNTVVYRGENNTKTQIEEYVFDGCALSVINVRREIECGTSDNAVLIGVGVSENPELSKSNGYNVKVTWDGSKVYVNGTRDIYDEVASLNQEQLVACLTKKAEAANSK